MTSPRRRSGLLSVLKGFAVLALLVLVVDIAYVLWPYPNGPEGIGALQAAVDAETALIAELTAGASARVIRRGGAWIHQAAFVWTGLDELMRRAAAPAPMAGANEFMRGFVRANWLFLETAAWGLQLFALRLDAPVIARASEHPVEHSAHRAIRKLLGNRTRGPDIGIEFNAPTQPCARFFCYSVLGWFPRRAIESR